MMTHASPMHRPWPRRHWRDLHMPGLASSASSPKWVPGAGHGGVTAEAGRVAGTEGRGPKAFARPARARAAADLGAQRLRARGRGPGLCMLKAS